MDTVMNESANDLIASGLEAPHILTTSDTVCGGNSLDTLCDRNTIETPFKMSAFETECNLSTSKPVAFERDDTVTMGTIDTTCEMNSLNSAAEMNTLDTACAMNTLDTACEMNTLDTACEMNTLDTASEMNTLDTAYGMNTLDTACEMNTLDTAYAMNTLDTACAMNTLDTVCEMNTLDTACEMNTLDTACEMNTLNTACEINTLDTACAMNTLDTVCEMNTLDTACEMNTLDTACAMNTLDTACEMNTLDTACEMSTLDTEHSNTVVDTLSELNSLKTVANDGSNLDTSNASINPIKNIVETMNDKSHTTKKCSTAEESDDEPLKKKAKLDMHTPIKDYNICSQLDSVKEEKVKNDTDSTNGWEEQASSQSSNSNIPKPNHEANSKEDKIDGGLKPSPLTEAQAGITEYIGRHKGFSAIIKQRYSDFIVNEIDMKGNVVHLTQMESPESLDEQPVKKDKEVEVPSDVLSSEDLEKLESLIQSDDKKAVVNIIAPEDKDSRFKIHLAIKKKYTQLETKTLDVDNQKMIQVMWKSGKSRDRNEDKDKWPESKRDCQYVKFVLYKENKDTMDAVGLIAKNLRVKEGLFQFAGTKDRRAKTSQDITAHRIHPKKLSFMNRTLWNIGIGNFEYVKEPLKLGQLSGNQFTIVLRNVQGTEEDIEDSLNSMKTNGFVNYFGMQRFGTTSVPTHRVGCALLHGNWEEAVDLILIPREDNRCKDAFQKVWIETKDPVATLKVTPSYCGLERNILEALKKKMKPFNALEKISRNTRLLYVHSYQALVWNKMVSKRLKVFGYKPIIGDLVQTEDSDSTNCSPPVVVTEDNLDQFSLNHVILPLPGYDVVYPKNEVYSWYRETLEADGLNIDNMKKPQKDYSLPGAYRHITVCPTDVSWTHHLYDDYTLSLTQSDMDIIKGNQLPLLSNKGKFKAVVLKMNLPSSTYATIALREILRMDTSVAHQTTLNVT